MAKALDGATRTANAFGTADVTHERYSIECKARARFAFIEKAFSQAEAAIPTGSFRTPLVVLKPDGAPAIYCLREAEFLSLLRGADAVDGQWKVKEKLRAISRLAREALDESR